MHDSPEPAPLSLRENLFYCAGQFACGAYGYIALPWILYLYRGNADAGLAPLVPLGWFSLVMVAGRLFDAITDPLIGYWSDRTYTRWGRRKPFIAAAALPLLVFFLLLWTPPVQVESPMNALYLLVILFGFFGAFTVAFGPYLAMLPELGRSSVVRNSLATNQAAFNVAGIVAGTLFGMLYDRFRAAGGNASHGFLIPALIVGGAATVLLLLPLFGRTEETRVSSVPREGMRTALGSSLSNRPFQHFIAAFLMVWLALQLLIGAMPHLPIARLGASPEQNATWGTILQATVLLGGALCFPAIKWVMDRKGRGFTLLVSMVWVALVAPLLALPHTLAGAMAVLLLAAPGMGGILVAPHAVLADVTDHDAKRTGERREAIFFGLQGLMTKIAVAVAVVLVGYLLQALGNTAGRSGGIVACAFAASGALLLGIVSFLGYERALADVPAESPADPAEGHAAGDTEALAAETSEEPATGAEDR